MINPNQKDGPIAQTFRDDDTDRRSSLDRARVCAALTMPAALPPDNQTQAERLPECFQSLGARGFENLVGKLLASVWPVGAPWVQYDINPTLLGKNGLPDKLIKDIEDQLFLREIVVQTAIESAGRRNGPGIPTAFYTAKRTALTYVSITGDVLEHVDDENRIHPKRRDRYVTRREGDGSVAYHIVHDTKDALGLSDETLAMAGLNRKDFDGRHRREREFSLWTMVEWQPFSRRWVITQELNGKTINTSEETYSPFLSSTWNHCAPEHYGRGRAELLLPDLRTFDNLSEYVKDWAALASKHHPCVDPSSEVDPRDLTKPSGEPLFGPSVHGGKVQDVAYLSVERLADFSIVERVRGEIKDELGQALLLQSASVRDSERTTAFEVAEVTIKELQGALGGIYASVADEQQIPLIGLIEHRLIRSGKLPKLPDDTVDVKTSTGLASLARQADANKVLRFLDNLGRLPQDLAAMISRRIDDGVLTSHLAKIGGVFVPGLIKSEERLRQELEQVAAQQAQAAAAQKAIDTVGNVVEANATAA